MKSGERNVGKTLEQALGLFSNPGRERMESAGEHVLKRLESETGEAFPEEVSNSNPVRSSWRLRGLAAALVAAIALAVLIPTMLRRVDWQRSAPGVLETATGSRNVRYGEIVGSDRDSAVLALADGSSVEMRSESELALETAEDGIRIRLGRGSVIVSAAEQRSGHLYVETRDIVVSVAGTVFFVKTEETGSRVAVIQGEVHVQESGNSKALLPGEQVTTEASREPSPVAAQISWSRHAPAHMALLQQSAVSIAPNSPEFEAASIRVNTSGTTASRLGESPERVTISNATLMQIIRYAYKDYRTRITGPSLLETQRYDIVAKAPSGTPDSQLLPMLQTLLIDRFKMQLHRETTEMPLYALVVAKGGAKLRGLKPGELLSGGGAGNGPRPDGLASTTHMGDLGTFAASLSRHMDRPVVDQTGLSGRFAISLTYLPDRLLGVEGASGPSLFIALEEQLGLKLEPMRGPIEIIVIDHIEEPDPN